jgi:hypothetical protein
MKYLTFSIILLLKINIGLSSSIGLGVVSDKISFWRYWEKSDVGYIHKMIVFNIADSTTALWLEQREIRPIGQGPGRKKNLYVGDIKTGEYKILEMPYNIDEYIGFYINGEYKGIIPISTSKPPEGVNNRFVSDEVFNGRNDFQVWIGKNHLFTKNQYQDTIKLYVYYDEGRIRYLDDGFFRLILRPFKEYEYVDVRLNNKSVGRFDPFGKFTFETPYKAALDTMYKKVYTNDKKILDVIYKINTQENLFLGLSGFSGIGLIRKDRLTGRLNRDHVDGLGFYLPVFHKKN